jgi:hypothetical protein
MTQYPVTQIKVASPESVELLQAFLRSLPKLFEDDTSKKVLYKAYLSRPGYKPRSPGGKLKIDLHLFGTIVTYVLQSLLEVVPEKLSVAEDKPDWMTDNAVYSTLDTSGLNDELCDLLDVVTSDWFKPSLRSINRATIPHIKEKHEKWVEHLKTKALLDESPEDKTLVCELPNGWFVYKLMNAKARSREGSVMHHCLGGAKRVADSTKHYSVRDAENKSILTLEGKVVKDSHMLFLQIRGFANRKVTLEELQLLQAFFLIVNGIACLQPSSIDTGEKLPTKIAAPRGRRHRIEEDEEDEDEDDDDEDEFVDLEYDEDDDDDDDEFDEDEEYEDEEEDDGEEEEEVVVRPERHRRAAVLREDR